MKMTVGSVCSGIEAASVAWQGLGADFVWFSEIAAFQSRFLAEKYKWVPNIGDLSLIPEKIEKKEVACPDVICGGTPCQAFSLTGHKRGLDDERGRLTLKFIEVIEANDSQRVVPSLVFWENVEGVLKDKTNAFGCFISGLAGCNEVLTVAQWPNAGIVRGPRRNVAWRVLDAKYFGVPQQRRRLYVVAGGKDFRPENVLFEFHKKGGMGMFPSVPLRFEKGGKQFEVFREYTDCLYSAYGTKWNGNAAAYNGSLYVVEDGRLRRMTPLECERLMGFPDNYTKVDFASNTNRYQGVGNSWAVPVVRWIGERLLGSKRLPDLDIGAHHLSLLPSYHQFGTVEYFDFGQGIVHVDGMRSINTASAPEAIVPSNIHDIIDTDAFDKLFISPVGCKGILRRAKERHVKINPRLETIMRNIASQLPDEEIEKISRVQPRGAFSRRVEKCA